MTGQHFAEKRTWRIPSKIEVRDLKYLLSCINKSIVYNTQEYLFSYYIGESLGEGLYLMQGSISELVSSEFKNTDTPSWSFRVCIVPQTSPAPSGTLWFLLLSQPHPSHGSVLPKAALKNGHESSCKFLCFNLRTHVTYSNKEEIFKQAIFHMFLICHVRLET